MKCKHIHRFSLVNKIMSGKEKWPTSIANSASDWQQEINLFHLCSNYNIISCFNIMYNVSGQLPWWLSGKESACQSRRHRFNPWVGKIPWRRKWQPTPVVLPGKCHGQRSLVGYGPWGHRLIGRNLATKQQQKNNVLLNCFYHKIRTDYTKVHKSFKKGHDSGQGISQRASSFRHQEGGITIAIKQESLFPLPGVTGLMTPTCKLSILGISRTGSLKGKRRHGSRAMRWHLNIFLYVSLCRNCWVSFQGTGHL